jgi:hypothetical protein
MSLNSISYLSTPDQADDKSTIDLLELFQIFNPGRGGRTCVGFSDSRNRRCEQALRGYDSRLGDKLLLELAEELEHESAEDIEEALCEIAEIYLCTWHSDQSDDIVKDWTSKLRQSDIAHSVISKKSASPITGPASTQVSSK